MRKIKYFALCLVTLVTALSFSSCGEEEYYYSPLAGNWALVGIDGYPVAEADVVEFCLYDDGTGTYGQYYHPDVWSTVPLRWSIEETPGGAEYLHLHLYDGQHWVYMVRLYAWNMELIDLDTGRILTFEEY